MTIDDDVCYRALIARDARFDGVFFTGVKTTGIYCRPVCTAKTPGRDRCRFFASPRILLSSQAPVKTPATPSAIKK
jgi:AraC family transcriptional regulator of adaptative response / DNA-3-methyladenine glycosylase II